MDWLNPELAISALSLLKYNNGYFKSEKQAKFLIRQMEMSYGVQDDPLTALNNFGVPMQPGQKVCVIEGEVRWADYGQRSYRRVGYAFVFDDKGFLAKHRLHYYYRDNGNFSAPATDKTELNQWVRDDSIPPPEFAPPPAIIPSNWVGKVGEFIEKEVTVKSMKYIGQGAYGSIWQTKMIDDEGNVILFWNTLKGVQDLDATNFKINLRAKVKEHAEYKGMKQTVVGYAKIRGFVGVEDNA